MPQTKSGILYLSKTEIKEIELLLEHVQADINYGSGGSYGDGAKTYFKEITKVQNAIKNLRLILSNTIN